MERVISCIPIMEAQVAKLTRRRDFLVGLSFNVSVLCWGVNKLRDII